MSMIGYKFCACMQSADMLRELVRRERKEGIAPDPAIDAFMKVQLGCWHAIALCACQCWYPASAGSDDDPSADSMHARLASTALGMQVRG